MPLTYRIDPAARMLFIVAEGTLTQEERLDGMRKWLSDPAYTPGLNTLFDLSAAVSSPTLPELRQVVGFIERHAASIGRTKLAVVAGRPLQFGVARQFQALTESSPLQVQVFTTEAKALAWLHEATGDPS
jgi:hypothetical protein